MRHYAFFKIMSFFAALAIFMSATGCKDDNGNNDNPATNGDYSVEMTLSLSSEGDENYISPFGIFVLHDGEEASYEMVPLNKNWATTVSYAVVPGNVGAIVVPSLKEGIVADKDVTLKYMVKIEVTLKRDGEIVDYKTEEQTTEITFNDNITADSDLSDTYLFEVTANGITKAADIIPNDEDLRNPETTPVKDMDEKKVNGTLYLASAEDDVEDEECLHDNFIARFTNRAAWHNSPLGKGDYLYIKGNDINRFDKTIIRESLAAGTVVLLDDVANSRQLEEFCDEMGIYNPVAPGDEDGIDSSMFIVAASKTPFYSAEDNTSYHGLFFRVSTRAFDGGHISDYSQGVIADRVVGILNEINRETALRANGAVSRADGPADLKTVVSAYKVFISDDGCLQTRKKSDYRGSYAKNDTQSNVYNVEFDVWNVASGDRNYYYIHQEFLGSFSECYAGVNSTAVTTDGCHTIAKVCEWYGDNVTITTEPVGTTGLQIHRNSPATTNTMTTYTSGFQWELSGDVSWSQGTGWGGAGHGGISVSTSESYGKEDVTVLNNCVPGRKLSWTFELKRPHTSFHLFRTACTNMYEGAAAGRTSLNTGMDYIISFPNSQATPKVKLSLDVTLRSSAGKCGKICGERTDKVLCEKIITLPVVVK